MKLKEEKEICFELLVRNIDGGDYVISKENHLYKMIKVSSTEENDIKRINQILEFTKQYYSEIPINLKIIQNTCFSGKNFLMEIESPVSLDILQIKDIKGLGDLIQKEVVKIEIQEKCFGEIWNKFRDTFPELFENGS